MTEKARERARELCNWLGVSHDGISRWGSVSISANGVKQALGNMGESRFWLSVDCSGRAFDDPAELPNILRALADSLEPALQRSLIESGRLLRDSKGRDCGFARYINPSADKYTPAQSEGNDA